MDRTVRTIVIAVVIGATVTLAGCTAVGTTSTPTPTRSAVAAATDPVERASRYFSVLERPFASRDALPADSDTLMPDGFVPNSQRFVAERDGTRYWVAATDDGGVSLISRSRDPGSPDNWAISGGRIEPGAVVTSMQDEAGHQVALVSDGYAPKGTVELHELTTNVWTADLGVQREDTSGS